MSLKFWDRQISATLTICFLLWTGISDNLFAAKSEFPQRSALHIGSFNIQVFGQSKIKKPFVKDAILSIISRYDVIFIQEIRDDKNEAIYELLDLLNEGTGKSYQALVNTRLGRGEMKEQYAYFYDESVVSAVDSYVFNDVGDKFAREPFVARFEGQGRRFTLAGIHTTPTDVRGELRALAKVKLDAEKQYGDDNIFIIGDLNADCSYYKPAEGFDFFDDAPRMMIFDDQDTTVSPGSCAYDRVMGFGRIQEYASTAKAFNFMEEFNYTLAYAKLVSDHYPVEFTIATTGSLDPLRPIPNKPQPIETDVEEQQTRGNQSSLENLTPSVGICGIDSYLTPSGRCYGAFEGKKFQVDAECCTL